MCHYCGCRQIPLIRDYIAEHELVTWLGVRALEETGRGEMTKAQATVTQMRSELLAHWQGEEEGVFALMRGEELYREHIDPLIAEHRELDALLGRLDMASADDRTRLHHDLRADMRRACRAILQAQGVIPGAPVSMPSQIHVVTPYNEPGGLFR